MPSLPPLTDIGKRAGVGLGNAWNYAKNQCTYYVAQVATWIPAGMGNAADWFHNAPGKHLATTQTPTVGSVVVYGRGNGYDPANGHVALVTSVAADLKSFTVNDQNYDERGGIRTNAPSTMRDVLGFILPPGVSAGSTTGVASANPVAGIPNPLDAIGSGFAALGKALTQGVWLVAGVALIALGLLLLLAREFLNIRKPQVSVGPAKLSVLDGGKASKAKLEPAAEEAI